MAPRTAARPAPAGRARAPPARTASRRSPASRRSAPTRRATARRSRSAASSPASTTSTARLTTRSTRPTRASGSRRPTRDPAATTSNALFIAGIRRAPANPAGRDRLRHHDHRPRRDQVRPGRASSRPASAPPAARRPRRSTSRTVATINSTGNALPAPVVLDKATAEAQDRRPPVLPLAAGHARAAARGASPPAAARPSSATSSSSPAPRPSACSARTTPRRRPRRGRTRRPRSASRPTAAPATRPTRACRGSSTTQVDLDLFDVARNVVGPLSYSFSYYKVMPQLTGAAAPTIERGPINAAHPPAAPAPAGEHAAGGELQRRELLPGRARRTTATSSRRPNTTSAPTRSSTRSRTASRRRTSSPCRRSPSSPTAPTRSPAWRRRSATTRGYIATNNDGRGIATGFLVKNGTTATNGRADRRHENDGAWAQRRRVRPAPAASCSTARRTRSTSRRATCRFTALSNHFASQSHQTPCRVDEADVVRQEAATLQQAGRTCSWPAT